MSEKSPHQHLTHDQMMNTNPDEPFVKSSMTRSQELHVEAHAPYLKVWMFLLVFTVVEYFWARIFKDTFSILLFGLMFWAIIKASMVGWFFMHLKFEGNWVYAMLIPAGCLAVILTCALIPDLAMQPVTEENPAEEEATPVSLREIGGAPSIVGLGGQTPTRHLVLTGR
jgi:cytochrome c oxidase subunit 4